MTAIGSNIDRAAAIAIQSDGKIVVAGVAYNGSNDDFALARYQVASTSSQTIADNASATLEGVTITNHSGTSCTLTVTKYPVPPGGAPATTGEMPVIWQLTTTCSTYNYDLVFSYTDTELLFGNSVTEASLRAYRAPDTGGGFTLVGGTVNTTANTVTVTGVTQLSWWTLSSSAPTAVTLADFSAVQQGDMVLLTWETNSELNNRGFNLYRGTSAAGPDRQLNETLIPSQSQGNPGGFVYTWEDRADLVPGTIVLLLGRGCGHLRRGDDARAGERRLQRANRSRGHRAGREQHTRGIPGMAGRVGGALGSLDGRSADYETLHDTRSIMTAHRKSAKREHGVACQDMRHHALVWQ